MDEKYWRKVLAGITGAEPVNIDKDLPLLPKTSAKKTARSAAMPDLPPSRRLFREDEADMSFIGVRVTDPIANAALMATRLAAGALERGVVPIILTTLPLCGLERFGFRVERMSGRTDAELAACERELAAFWDLSIVIDAADVARLG